MIMDITNHTLILCTRFFSLVCAVIGLLSMAAIAAPPAGYTQTGDPDNFGATGANDHQTTTPIVLAPGDVFVNADFGYQPGAGMGATIGDTLWLDANANGAQDSGETGIPGVTVALIGDTNGNGVWDAGEPILASNITDASGAYQFTGVPVGGNYLVWVNDTANVLGGLAPSYDSDGVGTPHISAVSALPALPNTDSTSGNDLMMRSCCCSSSAAWVTDMPGNSKRKGAIKKTGKGNPTAGSGGRRRQGLEGKGPTPRAEDRPNHKIYKMKNATQKREAARPKRKQGDAAEWVAGRNPVVELLRATVPIHALYVAEGTERDERIREIFKLAAEQHVSLLEIGRIELDKLTGGAVHQGISAKLNAYEYADPASFAVAAAEQGEPTLIVMLDGVTDPRNLGAVIRSAAGFGAHGVVDLVHALILPDYTSPSALVAQSDRATAS